MKTFSIYKQNNLLFLNIMAMISRLYNRETKNDIAQRKGLRYRKDILDNMKSEELIANLFRISQTEQKLKRENIQGESDAKKAYYEFGNKIKELGGIMPEDLPIPRKPLKELEKENKNKLTSNASNK